MNKIILRSTGVTIAISLLYALSFEISYDMEEIQGDSELKIPFYKTKLNL